MRHPPKSCRIQSVDALPSNRTSGQKNICDQSRNYYAPSITTFILPTRPWTTPKVSATVIRASSWVNRSNLWRTASISLSPINFFVNFSCSTLNHGQRICGSALTKPPLLDLLCRQGKNREQFNHYLNDDIGYYRSRWDRRINFQTLKKISQAIKEIE